MGVGVAVSAKPAVGDIVKYIVGVVFIDV